ncbi:hypothetical protein Syun_012324 [Stephania yunnanensis]|uniref:Uncharacterized protein n=1 Tax=Stephania yunnanensis TaxID=152371 RepID=A0AAP0K002_9MAGN
MFPLGCNSFFFLLVFDSLLLLTLIWIKQSALTRKLPVRGSHETCSCSFVMVFTICSKGSGIALDLVKLFGGKSSVIRKRKEWDLYEPIVDLLSNEEVETLDAREERNAR